MTAKELIHLLKFIPGDTEITVEFNYCHENGNIQEQHEIVGVSLEGELQLHHLSTINTDYDDYYSPEEYSVEYDYDHNYEYRDWDIVQKDIEAAWEEHETSRIFQTAEEEEGYIEYQNTLYQQDKDLEKLIAEAHENTEIALLKSLNLDLNKYLLCKN